MKKLVRYILFDILGIKEMYYLLLNRYILAMVIFLAIVAYFGA